MTRVHLIGICGTAMATLAAMLKRKGLAVRGSDEHVYPPMSTFLEQEGIPILNGYDAAHITTDLDLVDRGQRDLARQPGARGSARSQDPVLFAARGRARALPVGRAVDRDRRHPRQDHDDGAGRLAADARGARPERAGRRHRRQPRRPRRQLPPRARPRLRHRGRRVRQRLLRQDREVPEVPAGHRRHRQHRVRPRRHLRGSRRRCGWRSGGWRTWCRAAGCCCSAPTVRTPPRWPRWRGRGSRRSAWPTGADWLAYDLESSAAGVAFRVQHRGSTLGVFRTAMAGAHNVKNALAAMAIAAEVGVETETDARGPRWRSPA